MLCLTNEMWSNDRSFHSEGFFHGKMVLIMLQLSILHYRYTNYSWKSEDPSLSWELGRQILDESNHSPCRIVSRLRTNASACVYLYEDNVNLEFSNEMTRHLLAWWLKKLLLVYHAVLKSEFCVFWGAALLRRCPGLWTGPAILWLFPGCFSRLLTCTFSLKNWAKQPTDCFKLFG